MLPPPTSPKGAPLSCSHTHTHPRIDTGLCPMSMQSCTCPGLLLHTSGRRNVKRLTARLPLCSDAGSVLLHLTSQGTQLAAMPTDSTPKRSLGFTHLQPLLMAGCVDGSLLVWDTETTALRDSFSKHHVVSPWLCLGSSHHPNLVHQDHPDRMLLKHHILSANMSIEPTHTCFHSCSGTLRS